MPARPADFEHLRERCRHARLPRTDNGQVNDQPDHELPEDDDPRENARPQPAAQRRRKATVLRAFEQQTCENDGDQRAGPAAPLLDDRGQRRAGLGVTRGDHVGPELREAQPDQPRDNGGGNVEHAQNPQLQSQRQPDRQQRRRREQCDQCRVTLDHRAARVEGSDARAGGKPRRARSALAA